MKRGTIRGWLMRWADWHDNMPMIAGGFVLVASLTLSAVAYFLGKLAQQRARSASAPVPR
jgi:hypothetical protein